MYSIDSLTTLATIVNKEVVFAWIERITITNIGNLNKHRDRHTERLINTKVEESEKK